METKRRNILKLTTEEKRKFLDSFDYIFSDIDGVVWDMHKSIEGSAAGFQALKDTGKKLNFITNNSVRSIGSVEKRFKNVNLDVNLDEIVHPARSIVQYLKSIKFEGLIYIIATEIFKKELRDAGFNLIDGPTKIIDESAIELLQYAFDRQPVAAVIIDVDFNLSSLKLVKAQVYLQNPNCLLIAGATDLMLPITKDMNIIGPGHFANILAATSKQRMITLGKPGKDLVDMLIKRYNIKNTKRALMIGDMLQQDIGFGNECGFQTLLVLSGGCTYEQMVAETNAKHLPDYYAECMGDFVEFMKDLNKSNV